ncbi:hypothetical protein NM688_g3785 [Phlebia brevispora]|uniref:Uncharacterized protein n=1 Tax=Phlebia brevispora TaxID=194682 RepID=A0ACC1T4K1_9APHY|nr:hypothetical protein NM688_g3785 [Phlebia brevispora]
MTTSASAVLVFLAAAVLIISLRSHRRFRLPPGPKGVPFFGNVFDLPKSQEWLTYAEWSKQYGSDIIYLNFVGTPVIVINSAKHATELFGKRSAIYSDRSRFVMVNELMGWEFDFAFMGYNDRWRELRRMFHKEFNAQAILKYQLRMTQEVQAILHRFVERPNDFMDHLRHLAGSIILFVTYGIKPLPKDDPHLKAADNALRGLVAATHAGAHLVDFIPALKYIPSWFPGAGFKRQAAEWCKATMNMRDEPFAAVKKSMSTGSTPVSIVSSLLTEAECVKDRERQEEAIRDMAGTAYSGGADTTVSALGTFLLAMVLHPEVQRKAQAEIDRVIGHDRLPTFEDEQDLPYITAVMREVLRWRPIAPLGRAILHDESVFKDPDSFNPDRFLTKEGTLDADSASHVDFVFGFARRACPGRFIGISSVWLTIATILTAFDVDAPTDEHGSKIMPSGEYTSGLAMYPVPFQCTFKPRSAQMETIISDAAQKEEEFLLDIRGKV